MEFSKGWEHFDTIMKENARGGGGGGGRGGEGVEVFRVSINRCGGGCWQQM